MGYETLKKIAKHPRSGTGAAAALPAATWFVQALTSLPGPPEWVYAALAIVGAAIFNEITD